MSSNYTTELLQPFNQINIKFISYYPSSLFAYLFLSFSTFAQRRIVICFDNDAR